MRKILYTYINIIMESESFTSFNSSELKNQTRGSRYVNPWEKEPQFVKPEHFKEARLYDSDIIESGWEVPRHFARKMYRRWLSNVRSREEYTNFRRQFIDIMVPINNGQNEPIKVFLTVPNNEEMIKKIVNEVLLEHGQPTLEEIERMEQQEQFEKNMEQNKIKFYTPRMGSIIMNKRIETRLTQKDLAKLLNIELSVVRDIERGNIVPFLNDRVKSSLEKYFGSETLKYVE